MKIKTLLKLAVVISLVLIVVIGLWVILMSKSYEGIKNNANISQQVNSAILQINSLSSDYLLYYQVRAYQQWKHSHHRLSKIIKNPAINHLNEFIDVKSLIKTHSHLLMLFERVEAARNKEVENKSILLVQQRKALSAQLLSTTQLMSLMAKELTESIEVKRKEIERQLFWLAIIIFVLFVITLLVSWSLIAYRIVIPVVGLKNHIANIDAEHLKLKHDVVRNDEVGDLINSFNILAEDLFKTTVSKDKLQIEVEERRKSEKELKKQQDLNTTVLESAANVIVILDVKGNIVKFNKAAEKLTGFSRNELLGKPIWDFVIPRDEYKDVKKVFDSLMKGNTAIAGNHENQWVTKSGEYRLIEWHNTIIYDELNNITHIVAIGYDITEKRNNESERLRMHRELEQSHKMEALGKLTGGIAHDFNNMLGIILGYTELALGKFKNDSDSPIAGYLEQVLIASNRAKELISKMLAFSRIDHSSSQAVHVASLLDENIKLMQSMLPSTIKLEVTKEDSVPDIIINPVQLQQVIMNLMINAKDAMDGVGTIKISLGYYHSKNQECTSCHQKITGDWVEIIVTDNGEGMPAEIIERIFEPFFTTKAVGQGTGMGLSVIHGIVKGHEGHIIVESNLGKGSSFHLLFPAVITETKLIDDNVAVKESKDLLGRGQRILIIDDQESLVDIQYELLNAYGYQCTKKYNSQEALELYLSDTSAFDLIITDQTMPDLTGLDLIDAIRNKGLTIPIIITTGYSDKIKSSKVEIDNVTLLTKPVEKEKLLKQVSRVIGPS